MLEDKLKENTYALTLLRIQETVKNFYVTSD